MTPIALAPLLGALGLGHGVAGLSPRRRAARRDRGDARDLRADPRRGHDVPARGVRDPRLVHPAWSPFCSPSSSTPLTALAFVSGRRLLDAGRVLRHEGGHPRQRAHRQRRPGARARQGAGRGLLRRLGDGAVRRQPRHRRPRSLLPPARRAHRHQRLRHGRLVDRALRPRRRRHLHQVGRRRRRSRRQGRGGDPRGRPAQPGGHRRQRRRQRRRRRRHGRRPLRVLRRLDRGRDRDRRDAGAAARASGWPCPS